MRPDFTVKTRMSRSEDSVASCVHVSVSLDVFVPDIESLLISAGFSVPRIYWRKDTFPFVQTKTPLYRVSQTVEWTNLDDVGGVLQVRNVM